MSGPGISGDEPSVFSRIAPLRHLDAKTRRMFWIAASLFVALIVLLAVFTPQDADTSTVPNSYLPGKFGAKAAYTLLEQSGYQIERWEQPLNELAEHANPQTVLIVAAPDTFERDEKSAVRTILRKGGRVLVTDFAGGMLLPATGVNPSKQVSFAACQAQPEGLQPLAARGTIWITPRAGWEITDPVMRTAYSCSGQPVVVEYPYGKGRAIWWASSTPLENDSISRGQNLELLLNSVGPAAGKHVYWDESLHGSLHGAKRSMWDFVSGPVWPLLWSGCLGLAILMILSFSRRSGPVRSLPQAPRTTPIEFLDALGGLYRATGATSTAVQIAWDRFRTQATRLTGLQGLAGKASSELDAEQIASTIERRFGTLAQDMKPDLIAAEEACWNEKLKPHRALTLVRALRQHEETMRSITSHGTSSDNRGDPLR